MWGVASSHERRVWDLGFAGVLTTLWQSHQAGRKHDAALCVDAAITGCYVQACV